MDVIKGAFGSRENPNQHLAECLMHIQKYKREQ